MELKEVHILNNTLHGLLTETAQNTLKQKIGSEKEYAKYLIALLEAVIGKRTSPSLKDLLNLLGISHIQNDLQQKATDIIEDIADLHFKGYNSEYTKWLKENKNEAFAIHLAFLKETKSGISQTERESLKNKLVNIDKLDAFEFEEKDIRSGIRMAERARLKKWFDQLYSELNVSPAKAPRISKFAIVFSLVIASSIVFAIVNPTVRRFIIEKYHKLIDATEPHEDDSETNLKSAQALPVKVDSISTKQNELDSIQAKPVSVVKTTNKTSSNTSKPFNFKDKKDTTSASMHSVEFSYFDKKEKTEKDFDNYFKTNMKSLKPIEGFWLLIINDKSNTGKASRLKSAIVQVAKNKYELIHLTEEGNIDKLPYSSYFELISNLEGYNFSILYNKKLILQSKASLQAKEGFLTFESEYNAKHFNFKNKDEMVRYKVNGYRKPTLNESKVNEK